ncbi:penicillin-binding protein 1C [Frigidibacter mobilis]|uniref:Penicillin-binding protein 1C n=1 Tax=Frigidibacter mobilis TaxID=1335048 RepID=A0A165SRF0_9RHOB|nr:penicillin-binding protein 1C [Frigidibacter mobilis]
MALTGGALVVKVRGGEPPFTWLANGAPVLLADRAREAAIPLDGPGFVTLSVIDARGRSAAVTVALR